MTDLPAHVRQMHRDDLKTLLKEAAQEGVRDFLEEIGVKRDDAHLLRSAVEFQKAIDKAKGDVSTTITQTLTKALIYTVAAGALLLLAKALGIPAAAVAALTRN